MRDLTAGELTRMRTAQDVGLPDTATIKRATATDDKQGGYTEAWTTSGTAACRVAQAGTPLEAAIAERAAGRVVWMVTVPYNTDVTEADQIVAGDRALQVIAVVAGSWETARRVYCVEVL